MDCREARACSGHLSRRPRRGAQSISGCGDLSTQCPRRCCRSGRVSHVHVPPLRRAVGAVPDRSSGAVRQRRSAAGRLDHRDQSSTGVRVPSSGEDLENVVGGDGGRRGDSVVELARVALDHVAGLLDRIARGSQPTSEAVFREGDVPVRTHPMGTRLQRIRTPDARGLPCCLDGLGKEEARREEAGLSRTLPRCTRTHTTGLESIRSRALLTPARPVPDRWSGPRTCYLERRSSIWGR